MHTQHSVHFLVFITLALITINMLYIIYLPCVYLSSPLNCKLCKGRLCVCMCVCVSIFICFLDPISQNSGHTFEDIALYLSFLFG